MPGLLTTNRLENWLIGELFYKFFLAIFIQ